MIPGAYVENAMKRFSGRVALVEEDRRWTFAELDRRVENVACGLRTRLNPGSRVGLFMVNRAEYLIVQLAIERAGMVRVPVNARSTAHELEHVMDDCGAAALIFDRDCAEGVAGLRGSGVWLCALDGDSENGPSWKEIAAAELVNRRVDVCPNALASINYTSGSSGVPKGVMLSHRAWHSVYRNMLIDRDIIISDRLAHVGPLTHASGTYATPFLLRGACNVIVPRGSLDLLLPTIAQERITAFTCVPTVLTRILADPDIDRHDLSSLRWIGYGAEPIQTNTLEEAIRRWGDLLTHNYGLTEAMMTCAFLKGADHVDAKGNLRSGCIGRPYTFVEIVLRNKDGAPVNRGEIGEITIASDHVMSGYWNQPSQTAQTLRDGWIWSGDLARLDDDGLIHLVGRSKEMLISGGFNIYPSEIEACLSGCPGVREAAVIGLPDEKLGEICTAFVVADTDIDISREGCQDYCKPLVGIRTPRQWHFIDQLPRSGNGKVDKAALKALAIRMAGTAS